MYAIRSYYAHGAIDGLAQGGILEEVAVADFLGDTGQFLVDHAAGADVDVTHFGVTHLTIGQTHVHAGTGDQGAGVVLGETIEDRGVGGGNGIELFLVV